jgi:hypothetical protein
VETLEKVQERAVRQVNNLKGTTYEQRLVEVGLDSLKDRREEADMILVYKVMHEKCVGDKNTWFKLNDNNGLQDRILTRAASDDLKIRQSRSNLDLRKNFFTQRVCEQWNRLPRQIRTAKSVAIFRREYRKVKNGAPTEGGRQQHGRERR